MTKQAFHQCLLTALAATLLLLASAMPTRWMTAFASGGVPATFTATLAAEQGGETPVPGALRRRHACDECGVIQSVRLLDASHNPSANGTVSNELTVRLADGTIRVVQDTRSADWRPYERLILIPGMTPAGT